jgi:hypothetical protein
MCCILIAPMAGCAVPELADLCAYGRRVMAPLCVKGGHSRPEQCAPVLAVVKQRALDDGCGPAVMEGAGSDQENGLALLA